MLEGEKKKRRSWDPKRIKHSEKCHWHLMEKVLITFVNKFEIPIWMNELACGFIFEYAMFSL